LCLLPNCCCCAYRLPLTPRTTGQRTKWDPYLRAAPVGPSPGRVQPIYYLKLSAVLRATRTDASKE